MARKALNPKREVEKLQKELATSQVEIQILEELLKKPTEPG